MAANGNGNSKGALVGVFAMVTAIFGVIGLVAYYVTPLQIQIKNQEERIRMLEAQLGPKVLQAQAAQKERIIALERIVHGKTDNPPRPGR